MLIAPERPTPGSPTEWNLAKGDFAPRIQPPIREVFDRLDRAQEPVPPANRGRSR
jgi:hypothetical protein